MLKPAAELSNTNAWETSEAQMALTTRRGLDFLIYHLKPHLRLGNQNPTNTESLSTSEFGKGTTHSKEDREKTRVPFGYALRALLPGPSVERRGMC